MKIELQKDCIIKKIITPGEAKIKDLYKQYPYWSWEITHKKTGDSAIITPSYDQLFDALADTYLHEHILDGTGRKKYTNIFKQKLVELKRRIEEIDKIKVNLQNTPKDFLEHYTEKSMLLLESKNKEPAQINKKQINFEENRIINYDCLDGLQQIKDDTFDIVVTSPPYNLGNTVRGNLYEEYTDALSSRDYEKFITAVISQLIRTTKHYVFFNFQIVTSNKIAYLKIFNRFRHNIKDIIIWHKKQYQPAVQPTCLGATYEFIVVFTKTEKAEGRTFERAFFNNRDPGGSVSNVIFGNNASIKEFNSEQGSNKAVMPQYVVRWILEKFAKKGDIIMDPFMGTGTTALVAKQLEMKYFGFEISKEYCDIANNRLKQNTLVAFEDKKDEQFEMITLSSEANLEKNGNWKKLMGDKEC